MRALPLIFVLALQQAPVFRAGVDFVSVDVVVTDGDDVPVTDLTKDDFEIVDRGKPQAIAEFEYVSIPVATRTVDLKAPRLPEPDVGTNVPPTPSSRQFVMIVDDLHLLEAHIIPVKKVMTDFIAAISPDDEVAIVFAGRSDLSQNFTRDVGRLLRAVDRVRDSMGFGQNALYGKQTLAAARSLAFSLKNVASSLAGSSHPRRAIVLVSAGTPIDPDPDPRSIDEAFAARLLRDELDDAYATARRSNVPIYTLDPRGGVTPEEAVRGLGPVNFEARAEIARRVRIQQGRLAEIAINTGGRAFTNNSDLTRAVREIVRENGSYYILGFSPDPPARDGRFHDIDVKVKRPGLRVRSRYGYTAAAAPAETASESTKPALDAAMTAGVNVSGLSLQAIVSPLAPAANGMRSAVTIEVTYPVPEGTRRISDDLRIRIMALDEEGKVKASVEQNRAFTGMAPDRQSVVTFLIDDAMDLPSQALTLRVGVASRALARTGTVQLPVDVPKPEGRLAISGLALTSEDQPPIGVMSKELIADLVPFQPVLTRSFAISDTIRVFGRLFWESRDASADVTVEVGNARSAVTRTLNVAGAVLSGNRRQGEIDVTLRPAELAPGDYVLRVSAKLGNGQTATREIPVTLR
jgi:VWFA-related protein